MSESPTLAAALRDIVEALQGRHRDLEARLFREKEQVAVTEAEIKENRLSLERAPNYQQTIGGDFQCPRCWIMDKTRSSLKPIPSQTNDDIFDCPQLPI